MGVGMATSAIRCKDPLFHDEQTDDIGRQHLVHLAAGTVAAVRINGMLSPELCARYLSELDQSAFTEYSPGQYPVPASRLGPVINDFKRDGDLATEYWADVADAKAFWAAHQPGHDIRQYCLDRLATAWATDVDVACSRGRQLYWGVLRRIDYGTLRHWDDVTREYPPDFLDRIPISQLAFNLYLSMPARGGETQIWRRRWRPADERHRSAFGYSEELFLGDESLTIRCEAGDALIFDPRNYHAVRSNSGHGHRLALAAFLGITADGGMILWS